MDLLAPVSCLNQLLPTSFNCKKQPQARADKDVNKKQQIQEQLGWTPNLVSEQNESKLLNQLANYAVWMSGGKGAHIYVVRQMNLLYATLSDKISYALVGDNPIYATANSLAH